MLIPEGKMYCPIVGTLGYVLSPDRRKTLLIHRNSRPGDHHLGKYNGLGGKMQANEDVLSCMRREILEEAGLKCEEILLRGTINWPGFGPGGESWLGFIFRIDRFSGIPSTSNEEGTLSWGEIATLDTLPMWEGDRYFLPLVFDGNPKIFHGCMPYKDGHPISWQYVRI
jgi:8-oxo-dGTP diphosphatase